MSIDDFRDLWEDGCYVLLRVPATEGGLGFVIVDRRDGAVELIDDDEQCPAVVQRLIDEGVPIVDELD